MKEATGELSTTVIAVVAIAAIAAIFTTLILPGLKGTILAKTHCAAAVNCGSCSNKEMECQYYTDENTLSKTKIKCPCEAAK